MRQSEKGFTIVELLIVIVVIAILAAITIVAYTGMQTRARDAAIATKESQARTKLELYKVQNDRYPSSQAEFDSLIGQASGGELYTTYSSSAPYTSFAISTGVSQVVPAGIADGSALQVITAANCPTSRIRAVDARDNHTYWVQKLADGKCWMLTNLAYAGGGTATYSDTKTLTNGTGGSTTYTTASYYVVPSTTNFTSEPAAPGVSTNGTGQYGYLYNWCAAMGGQQNTSACLNATSPAASTSISVCPAGWRLPVGNGNEFTALNTAVNNSTLYSDSGLISGPWMGQRGGWWINGFGNLGSTGNYWASTQLSAANAYVFSFSNGASNPANGYAKSYGSAVRCIAN